MSRKKLKMNLALFAEQGSAEKTEKATPKKRKKAREEGQVAKSQEIGTAVTFIFAFASLFLFAGYILTGISNVFFVVYDSMFRIHDLQNVQYAVRLLAYMFTQVILIALPMLLLTLLLGLIVNIAQVGFHITHKPIMPKLSKIDPIKGFKKIFSLRSLMDLAKSLAKLVIILAVVYFVLMSELDNIMMIITLPLTNAFMYVGGVIIRLGITVGAWFIFIAAVDYAFQRYKHNKDLRMSKQEVKDEYKQIEGNPQIKGRIRSKMREASMRRMMQDIPKADVIITNPTHYAVAVHYDRASLGAPKVVAKGLDYLAHRIKEIGMEHNITLVENMQLARALYAAVDVGQEIPPELYKAVAEVLAYVYKLKNPGLTNTQ